MILYPSEALLRCTDMKVTLYTFCNNKKPSRHCYHVITYMITVVVSFLANYWSCFPGALDMYKSKVSPIVQRTKTFCLSFLCPLLSPLYLLYMVRQKEQGECVGSSKSGHVRWLDGVKGYPLLSLPVLKWTSHPETENTQSACNGFGPGVISHGD